MTARVLRDAQDVTTVETTTKPIEVWLSRPHLEVTCRIVGTLTTFFCGWSANHYIPARGEAGFRAGTPCSSSQILMIM
jgi:hypothetical protein